MRSYSSSRSRCRLATRRATPPSPTDEALAELHDRLWPDEEWIDVEVCPWIDLIPHETWKAARKALRRGRSWRDGEVRYLVYRVHPCECGFWHVGPWWMRRRR